MTPPRQPGPAPEDDADTIHRRWLMKRPYSLDLPESSFDPYLVLGLRRGASKTDIRAAYLKLAKELHPDRRAGDAEAERRFKAINYAYHALLISPRPAARRTLASRLRSPATLAALAFLTPVMSLLAYAFVVAPAPENSTAVAKISLDIGKLASDETAPDPTPTGAVAADPIEKRDVSPPNAPRAPVERLIANIMPDDLQSESEQAFLRTLREERDMIVVHDYLRLEASGRETDAAREHLRGLILASRDPQHLTRFLSVIRQQDHVEAALALGRLRELSDDGDASREARRWLAAKRVNTAAAYRGYLRDFESGRYASESRARLAALTTPAVDLPKPVTPKPEAPPSLSALARAEAAKESEAWRAARQNNTPAAYAAYLARYPRGRYAYQAQRKVAAVDPPKPPTASRPVERVAPRQLWPTADDPFVERRVR
ncbi:MAG: J domain-containing protein [Hyphomicrobiales bacterium]|nr:J domain-containing protein [Hyphomicrobiales bacterium]